MLLLVVAVAVTVTVATCCCCCCCCVVVVVVLLCCIMLVSFDVLLLFLDCFSLLVFLFVCFLLFCFVLFCLFLGLFGCWFSWLFVVLLLSSHVLDGCSCFFRGVARCYDLGSSVTLSSL